MSRLPTWRIVLLRLCYLAIAIGLGMTIVPRLIWLPEALTYQGAALTSFLASLALLCLLGFFRPIAMLPVLLFELGWKFIYMLRIALPGWLIAGAFGGLLFAATRRRVVRIGYSSRG